MNKPTMETLARWLDRVERGNRRMKQVGAVALVVIAGVVLMGQATRSKASEEAPAGRATVKHDRVPVYGRMSTTSQVVSTLKRGTVVTVEFSLSNVDGAWCQVTVGGTTGYVRCDDLEREPAPRWQKKPSQATPPVAGRTPAIDWKKTVKDLALYKLSEEPGVTPLILAAYQGDIMKVQELLAAGGDVNASTNQGITALMAAALNGHSEVTRGLLAHGADVNASTNQGTTALMMAVQSSHSEVTRQLLAHGADVKAEAIWGETALWLAMRHNAPLSVIQLLLDAGADVHATERRTRTTPLLEAFSFGPSNPATVKALLDAGADVNARDIYGETPLMKAQKANETGMALFLKQAGAQR